MKFKFYDTFDVQTFSDDCWYALQYGGYIRPELLVSDEDQLEELNKAIQTVQDFFDQAEYAGAIEPV